MAALDITPLRNVTDRLREAVEMFEREPSDYLRDSVIKRFDLTYEVSMRMLKRALETASLSPGEVDQMSFSQMIRTADEQGFLLSSWRAGKTFRMRVIRARTRIARSWRSMSWPKSLLFKEKPSSSVRSCRNAADISMSETIAGLELTGAEWEIVAQILAAIIPEREVWAFGSRVHGRRLKRMSDLDLAVVGDMRLSWRESAALSEALDESLLPFKVDTVDWATTSERFREIIRAEHVVIQHPRPPSQ